MCSPSQQLPEPPAYDEKWQKDEYVRKAYKEYAPDKKDFYYLRMGGNSREDGSGGGMGGATREFNEKAYKSAVRWAWYKAKIKGDQNRMTDRIKDFNDRMNDFKTPDFSGMMDKQQDMMGQSIERYRQMAEQQKAELQRRIAAQKESMAEAERQAQNVRNETLKSSEQFRIQQAKDLKREQQASRRNLRHSNTSDKRAAAAKRKGTMGLIVPTVGIGGGRRGGLGIP